MPQAPWRLRLFGQRAQPIRFTEASQAWSVNYRNDHGSCFAWWVAQKNNYLVRHNTSWWTKRERLHFILNVDIHEFLSLTSIYSIAVLILQHKSFPYNKYLIGHTCDQVKFRSYLILYIMAQFWWSRKYFHDFKLISNSTISLCDFRVGNFCNQIF